jgi:dCTP deaminase
MGAKLPVLESMSIQSDGWIGEQGVEHRMIEPFSEKQVRERVISCGLSSHGYDPRVSDEFQIFTNANSAIIDRKGKYQNQQAIVLAKL